MIDRAKCPTCGALILPSTAAETGGACMPCKRGFRQNIEASQRRRLDDAKYRESPAGKHWQWLVQQVHNNPDWFEGLSTANQAFFAVGVLEGEVYNGGFEQYFFNSSSNYYSRAVGTLMEMGATNSLRLTIAAKEVLFGTKPVPPSTTARRTYLRAAVGSEEEASDRASRLTAIDKHFWKDPDKLHERTEAFADRHGLRKDF